MATNPRLAMATARVWSRSAPRSATRRPGNRQTQCDERGVHGPKGDEAKFRDIRREKQTSKRVPPGGGIPLRYIEPQLCELVTTPPVGDKWVHEAKLHGYRIQLHVSAGRATL
jgi:ATP-dependent DNA ligase